MKNISSRNNQVIVDKSYGVKMTFSDSAVVKNEFFTPEAFHFNAKEPYWEMKKGITVIFYDINQKEEGRIVADYAIWKEVPKTITLQRNVVLSSVKGDTFKSEEMVWDQNKHQFYSNKLVTWTSPSANGTPSVLYGDGFTSDENLKHPSLIRGRGNIMVTEQQGL